MSLELPHTTHQHQHHQREHHHVELGAACNASTANMARAHKYAHSKNSKHIRAMLRTKAMRDVNRMRFLLYLLGVIDPLTLALMLTSKLIPNPCMLNTPPVHKHKPIYPVARRLAPNVFVRQFVLPSLADIDRLCTALGIPDVVHFGARCVAPGIDVLLVALRRLSHADTWEAARLSPPFNTPGRKWSGSKMSEAFKWLCQFLWDKFGSVVEWSNAVFHPARARMYAAAMKAKGCLVPRCTALMDCMLHKVARPVRGQEACFTGYKKIHFNKW